MEPRVPVFLMRVKYVFCDWTDRERSLLLPMVGRRGYVGCSCLLHLQEKERERERQTDKDNITGILQVSKHRCTNIPRNREIYACLIIVQQSEWLHFFRKMLEKCVCWLWYICVCIRSADSSGPNCDWNSFLIIIIRRRKGRRRILTRVDQIVTETHF